MVGPLSAIQPFIHLLTLTSPGHWGYSRELVFGNWFHSRFVCNQHMVPRNIKHSQTPPSHGTSTSWLIGRVEPRRFISRNQKTASCCQCRTGTSDLSIFIRTRYHWTNTPKELNKGVKIRIAFEKINKNTYTIVHYYTNIIS